MGNDGWPIYNNPAVELSPPRPATNAAMDDPEKATPEPPASLERAWDACLFAAASGVHYLRDRDAFARARGFAHPCDVDEADFPLHLRKWASPSGSGWFHPPACVCGRPTCPAPPLP